ncbi:MAG: hypothetical protein S4CHLAM102_11840 [Chlamydiia bacterium]|nr:hypothetical protein [Chlamydiia bacterium]
MGKSAGQQAYQACTSKGVDQSICALFKASSDLKDYLEGQINDVAKGQHQSFWDKIVGNADGTKHKAELDARIAKFLLQCNSKYLPSSISDGEYRTLFCNLMQIALPEFFKGSLEDVVLDTTSAARLQRMKAANNTMIKVVCEIAKGHGFCNAQLYDCGC